MPGNHANARWLADDAFSDTASTAAARLGKASSEPKVPQIPRTTFRLLVPMVHIMQRIVIPALICFALCTLTFAYAQQSDTSRDETNDFYRVMSLAEMFEGDADAMKKVRSMMITVTRGDKATTVRTDMDAEDYERALNRLGVEKVSDTELVDWARGSRYSSRHGKTKASRLGRPLLSYAQSSKPPCDDLSQAGGLRCFHRDSA